MIPWSGRSPGEGNGNLLQDYYYFFNVFIYLAVPGLTCGMWDHTQVHLHWEHGILATGPPGKSPLQYSRLENPTDRGDWWATIHGVAKSKIQLSDSFHRAAYSGSRPFPTLGDNQDAL